jgi:hypothetical protein
MYRNSVDQAISYTAQDFVLFRESPFACWMERLSLENPGHGIPPDVGGVGPSQPGEPQDNLADTLKEEGKDVILIEWQDDEAVRRTATLAAMRHGVDFIVNGQLAVGPLSETADLLMRTSGYSELGNYLYIPCDTQLKTTLASAFRLCFLADLLHSLQGQLPPQMLILRGSSEVVPLQTEDHIYHYKAVKQRFMTAQASFKKHQMPDPVESAHFGRWSDCANELLKQRALGQTELEGEEQIDQPAAVPKPPPVYYQAVVSAYDMDVIPSSLPATPPVAGSGDTLAEQARLLNPDPASPGVGAGVSQGLQNLEFIGSSSHLPTIGQAVEKSPAEQAPEVPPPPRQHEKPPPPNLRNPAKVDMDVMPEAESTATRPAIAPFSNSLITNHDG